MELGSGEILLILVVALLVYGGRLPEVARAIGRSFGELKRGFSETKEAVASELDTGIGDAVGDPMRDVRRVHPAHEDLAKEDISGPGAAQGAKPGAAQGAERASAPAVSPELPRPTDPPK